MSRNPHTIERSVTSLSQAATECEFWATQPETPYWDKAYLTRRAHAYRQEQLRIMEQEQLELAPSATMDDLFVSATALDLYTGFAAIAGLILVAEIVLAIF